MKILFLDDEVTRVLEFKSRTGLEVDHVTNVTDFIQAFNRCHYDVVMLDHDLGNDEVFGTGAQAAKWLAENRLAVGDDLVVVIHSANLIGVANMISHLKYADHLQVYKVHFAWAKVRFTDGQLQFNI